MTGVDAPQYQGLQDGKEHGGQLRAPEASRSVVVFASVDRAANGIFREVIVQRYLWVIHKQGQAWPMIEQTLADLALLLAGAFR